MNFITETLLEALGAVLIPALILAYIYVYAHYNDPPEVQ